MHLPAFLASSTTILQREMLRRQLVEDAIPLFDSRIRSRLQAWPRPEVAGYVRARAGATFRAGLLGFDHLLDHQQQADLISEVVAELVKLLHAEVRRPKRLAA